MISKHVVKLRKIKVGFKTNDSSGKEIEKVLVNLGALF